MPRPLSAPLHPPPRLVLDTNVVLDLLVFDDPAVRPLVQGLTAGELTAWVDGDTLGELEYVLAYPTFKLDEAARRAASARYRSLVHLATEDMVLPHSPCLAAGTGMIRNSSCSPRVWVPPGW
uniref:Twitching motility protein PilT n=1 Tax=Vitiosangium cumulatum TaxID=1867796 RepID=A0A7D4XLP0_9BACT|nr:twitching motility protein PilT [Vitiosangium cumulatum]